MKYGRVGKADMRLAVVFACLCMMSACADSYVVQPGTASGARMSPDASVFITVPADGRYGEDIYDGSGAMTTQAVAHAFFQHVGTVKQAERVMDAEEAMDAARAVKADYLVVPIILHWEDRATEWSGRPDRVSVRLSISNTVDGKTVASTIIEGKSGLATFGGDHPQDLLPRPIDNYIASLFS